ncbi:MAG TPA: fluoride efflux transporter CrcB [Steroidobacteraceae bacterium]|jgi:CrcB protein
MVWQGLAVGIGAALGALLRWRLGACFNAVFPTIPFGTLACNLIGGFLMGLCMEYFARNAALPPELRLAATTGFLGGLTTFSTFSAETADLLLRRDYLWSAAIIGAHLIGSVVLTIAGIFCVRALLGSRGLV